MDNKGLYKSTHIFHSFYVLTTAYSVNVKSEEQNSYLSQGHPDTQIKVVYTVYKESPTAQSCIRFKGLKNSDITSSNLISIQFSRWVKGCLEN